MKIGRHITNLVKDVRRIFLCKKLGLSIRPSTSDKFVFDQIFFLKIYGFGVDVDATTIIDAGANVGYSSVYFAMRFPGARILAIEPDHANFEALRRNTQAFPNIVPIHAALGGTDCSVSVIDQGQGEWGFVTTRSNVQDQGSVTQYSMATLLDTYDVKAIDIAKIDIEGSEKELFESDDIEWLQNVRYLTIELHDRNKPGCSISLFKALVKYPFFAMETSGEGLLFRNTTAFEHHQR